MIMATSSRPPRTWSVQDAKAKLSEVLRRAREEGPQIVGTAQPCVVVPLEAWEQATSARMPLGQWLVRATPRGEPPLELPDRREPDRPTGIEEP
jgi:prevent-host-death family protein